MDGIFNIVGFYNPTILHGVTSTGSSAIPGVHSHGYIFLPDKINQIHGEIIHAGVNAQSIDVQLVSSDIVLHMLSDYRIPAGSRIDYV